MKLQDFTEAILRNPTELVQDDLFYSQSLDCTGLQFQGYATIIKKLPPEIIKVLKLNTENLWLKGRYSDKNIDCNIILTMEVK